MKVLMPIDGSSYGGKAVDYLLKHSAFFGSDLSLTLLHVNYALPPRAAAVAGAEFVAAYHAEETRRIVDPVVEQLQHAGFTPVVLTKSGQAGEVIAQEAEAGAYDMVLMGSHGQSNLMNLVMGSVATRVLASCKVPVLLVR